MRLRHYVLLPFLAVIIFPSYLVGATTHSASPAPSTGVFSIDQALRGQATYVEKCAHCHGDGLEGIDVSPPLAGSRFMSNWLGQSAADLASRIRMTMPIEQPGSLSVAQSADVVAFILQENGFPAGMHELPASGTALRAVLIDNSSTARH